MIHGYVLAAPRLRGRPSTGRKLRFPHFRNQHNLEPPIQTRGYTGAPALSRRAPLALRVALLGEGGKGGGAWLRTAVYALARAKAVMAAALPHATQRYGSRGAVL